MSNGNGGNNCFEVYIGDGWAVGLDTKEYGRHADGDPRISKSGVLLVMRATDYQERIDRIKETKNPTHLFDSPEQHSTLNEREMTALAAYAGAHMLDTECFAESGSSVIARESMSDLTEAEIAPLCH